MNKFFSIGDSHKRGWHIRILGRPIPCLSIPSEASAAFGRRFNGLTDSELLSVIKCQYKEAFGRTPDLLSPKTFNEKLNWEKLHYQNPLMTVCADKVKCRDFLVREIPQAEKYLVKQFGVYSSANEIAFESLPNSFILKSNWGSGSQVFVHDKKNSNLNKIRQVISKWTDITSNHYYNYFEWGYKNIPPRIIAEEILSFQYKIEFFCFNGTPRFFWVVLDDKTKSTAANFYNLDWSQICVRQKYPNFSRDIPRPDSETFNQMIEVAKILSRCFPFVRCDFYKTPTDFKFSELTFYHWGAYQPFDPESFDSVFGKMLELPNTNSISQINNGGNQ